MAVFNYPVLDFEALLVLFTFALVIVGVLQWQTLRKPMTHSQRERGLGLISTQSFRLRQLVLVAVACRSNFPKGFD